MQSLPSPARGVFANRTLNLRAIQAVGCDMDYTLVHYHQALWEARAYEHARARLEAAGWPVAGLAFDPDFTTRGLILDLQLGNIVKANRFGYVARAAHGQRMLEHDEQRKHYGRTLIELSEPRWVFMNTSFSLSEACLFAQLVDLADAGKFGRLVSYADLYGAVRDQLNEAHMEGRLKAEIVRDPERFVVPDKELPLALLDLKHAGKKLLVITNSEWAYTRAMLSYAFDPHLPDGMTYRDLFDLIIVGAAKPRFFTGENPIYEVADEAEGLLRPVTGKLVPGAVYHGGHARLVEQHLGLPGEEILYVGDHLYADVHVTKDVLRWRTALVVRELEAELEALTRFADRQRALDGWMRDKTRLEQKSSLLRLELQRTEAGYGHHSTDLQLLKSELAALRASLKELDSRIVPAVSEAASLGNPRWGLMMRAGNDKSRMARMVERYADVYMSRVSNLLAYTPFAYLRAEGGSLPHDPHR
jgi:5'-nucleotidase